MELEIDTSNYCKECGSNLDVKINDAIVPASVLKMKGLTTTQKLLFGLFYSNLNANNYCSFTNEELGDLLGYGIKSIEKDFKALRDLDLIKTTFFKRQNKEGRFYKVRYIYLKTGDYIPIIVGDLYPSYNRDKSKDYNDSSASQVGEVDVMDGNKLNTKQNKKNDKVNTDKFFEDMWSEYTLENMADKVSKTGGKRGGGSKASAKTKFYALLKNKITIPQIEIYVSDYMQDNDYPKDLENILKVADLKQFVADNMSDENETVGKFTVVDLSTNKRQRVTEEEYSKMSSVRFERVSK